MRKSKLRILNAGCGGDTYGTDFVDIKPCRHGVLKADLDKDKLPFANNSFGIVYAKSLFEHLSNPHHFLAEAKRVLKPGGRLVIITDNASCFLHYIPIRKLWRIHTGTHISGSQFNHYAVFTPFHLENHLKRHGFEIEKVSYSKGIGKWLSLFIEAVGVKPAKRANKK